MWDFDFEGGYLWGLDAGSGAVRQKVLIGSGEHFVSVSASAGGLYVPARRSLHAFGI